VGILECDAEEGWGKSIGAIMWKVKQYYKQPGRKETSLMQKNKKI
jgi:hypothetical protein